jgi:hypothetical protein
MIFRSLALVASASIIGGAIVTAALIGLVGTGISVVPGIIGVGIALKQGLKPEDFL